MGEHHDAKVWAMLSNRGTEWFRLSPLEGAAPPHHRLYRVEVGTDGWDRDDDDSRRSAPVHRTELGRVPIRDSALAALCGHLALWQERFTPFECVLTPEQDGNQRLTVRVGPDPGVIHSRDKAVFCVVYTAGIGMEARWSFVVDPSCLRELVEGRG
ncbi:hypothetical protein [Stenotrophomonas sp. HMWF003]|uniref:hypothetical protein n=1 Tax=Stenotrophomonas sp. HMWF003 TaxID=2056840 RepID=UPI000D45FD56|nr:hypothetical protein [Stenotrophomonas sp. HMWF003]PTT58410.1 hypothetical protein DBR34_18190 [Stenotrophomonas sp. HMWF003]